MQEIDERAVIDYGVPSLELMENAGQGIVDALTRRFHDLSTKRILVFCGKGNNGGDGLVIARLLFNVVASVKVLLLEKQADLKNDTSVNAGLVYELGINIIQVQKANKDVIEREAKKIGVDPDLVKAIVYLETTHGWYDKFVPFGLNKTIRPFLNTRADVLKATFRCKKYFSSSFS